MEREETVAQHQQTGGQFLAMRVAVLLGPIKDVTEIGLHNHNSKIITELVGKQNLVDLPLKVAQAIIGIAAT